MNVIVHDNWLNPVYFNVLKEYILSTEFAWYKGEVVEDVGQVAPMKKETSFFMRSLMIKVKIIVVVLHLYIKSVGF